MLRQYDPQRFRVETIRNKRYRVGTIGVGTILRPHNAGCKVIVEGWMPREIGAYRKNDRGYYVNGYTARGGHLALVRRLDNGQRFPLSDAWLRDAEEFAA